MQGELRLKGSPHLGPIRSRGVGGQSLPMQKAMLNRQQSARQRPAMAPPPIQTVMQHPRSNLSAEQVNSPMGQPTPPSQRSSPSALRSPGYPLQGLASPVAEIQPRQQYSRQRQMPPLSQNTFHPQQRTHNRSMSANTVGQPYPRRSMHVPVSQTQANYYPPSFQKHYDQLGKSTSPLPFPLLSGSFVRPRLIPLVQTRSTMHKPRCLTMIPKKWIPIALFQTFDYLRHLGAITVEWTCKHLHPPQPARRVMLAITCRLCLSIMTRCLMLIHLDSAHRCIFQTHLVACNHHEGKIVPVSVTTMVRCSERFYDVMSAFSKVVSLLSDGAGIWIVHVKMCMWIASEQTKHSHQISTRSSFATQSRDCASKFRH